MHRSLVSMLGGVFALLVFSSAQAMTPLEDCARSTVPTVCLDAKLKQANLQLNAALKAATRRIEALQKSGERSVLSPFVNSQRQFNSYRDTNCSWQAIAAPQADKSAFIKDCQIRATIARAQELLAFANSEAMEEQPATVAAAARIEVEDVADETTASPVAEVPVAEAPVSESAESPATPTAQITPPVASGTVAASPRAGVEWQLQSWRIEGTERQLVPGSQIAVSFDPSGKVAGNGSVNRFSGDFRFDQNGRIVWPSSGFAVSKMAGPPELMNQERSFLQALRRMSDFRADGSQLILESASGKTVLTFARN